MLNIRRLPLAHLGRLGNAAIEPIQVETPRHGRRVVRCGAMSLLRWDLARIFWTPPGHTLQVHHRLNDRASELLALSLQQWLDQQDWGGVVAASEGQSRTEDDRATRLGWINVTAETLLAQDPAALGDVMDGLAEDAERRAGESVALEEQMRDQFLAVLRQTPPPRGTRE